MSWIVRTQERGLPLPERWAHIEVEKTEWVHQGDPMLEW